ncbi:uncharacterized protein [Chironomus tepperi]|uniref:uncharacterized protein n=1 Tax=Chironomus tepperi TaxID=113505 RepID=UPI00391F0BDA
MEKKSVKFKNNPKLKETAADFSQCIPPDLHDRLSKYFQLPFPKNEPFEEKKKPNFRELLQDLDQDMLDNLGDEVNEDNFADAIENYQKAKSIDLKIEGRIPERRELFHQDINWIADYTKKMKRERIVWQTKLFKDNQEIYEKPLFEQTEELIDIAADHFAVWLKQMDDESNINKEFVKQLFAIQVEADASKALHVEPKEISVISHEVAKMLNLKKLSIQNNLKKMIRRDKKMRARKVNTVAFGRCLPKSIRVDKFNEELFDDQYSVNCPEDLQSLKTVFDSILHLSSTRQLVEYLKKNPELPRSKFLIDSGMFKEGKLGSMQMSEKPLWSYFY